MSMKESKDAETICSKATQEQFKISLSFIILV